MTHVLLDTLTVTIISGSSEYTEEVAKHTASNLQNIMFSRKFKNNCLNDLIENFSFEILSKDVKISACGFFNINYKTFGKV